MTVGPPVLVRRGDRFAVSGVRGVDPRTGELGATAEAQLRLAFEALAGVLVDHGRSLEEVGRVTVYIADHAMRPLINPPWCALFPDPGNRPARKTTRVPLEEGLLVELDVVGVVGERRTSLEIDGVGHRDPLPMGARLGAHVFSSVLSPDVPGGGRAERVAAIDQVFANASALMAAAGGSLGDVQNVWSYLGMWDLHPAMVDVWVAVFPDESIRPSRKTYYYPDIDFQVQFDAVIGGRRRVHEIPGLGHRDPIPMAATCGATFTSSGVDGRDPGTGSTPRGVAAQSVQTLDNLGTLLAGAGHTAAGLFHVTALLGSLAYASQFRRAWAARFSEGSDGPALQVIELGLPARDVLVQVIAESVSPDGAP